MRIDEHQSSQYLTNKPKKKVKKKIQLWQHIFPLKIWILLVGQLHNLLGTVYNEDARPPEQNQGKTLLS